MDLLETILRSAKAENYIKDFRSHEIDTYTLKILSDEDLRIIGVKDEDTRRILIQQFANLQIPAEKWVQPHIDKRYMLLVLNQISMHLHKHFANLTCAVHRTDINLSDIELTQSVECLQMCSDSLNTQLKSFEDILIKRKEKLNRKWKNTITLILLPTSIFLTTLYVTKFVIK